MMSGTIVRLLPSKAFGFVKSTINDKEYFFHREDFIGHWEDLITDYESGAILKVEFKEAVTSKGLRAQNVRRTEHPNEAV